MIAPTCRALLMQPPSMLRRPWVRLPPQVHSQEVRNVQPENAFTNETTSPATGNVDCPRCRTYRQL